MKDKENFNLNPVSITTLKRGRGRPRKPEMNLREQEDAVILKYLNHEPMTLEETALALWMRDGRPKCGPMSKMGIMKMEARICAKLRTVCEKAELGPEVLQMFGNNYAREDASRSHASPAEY